MHVCGVSMPHCFCLQPFTFDDDATAMITLDEVNLVEGYRERGGEEEREREVFIMSGSVNRREHSAIYHCESL